MTDVILRSSRKSARTWRQNRWENESFEYVKPEILKTFSFFSNSFRFQVEVAFAKFDQTGNNMLDYRFKSWFDLITNLAVLNIYWDDL